MRFRLFLRSNLTLFLLLLLLLPATNIAQSLGNAGAFMRLGIGARAGSMGDAYVAAASGPEAIYWNPAVLSLAPTWQVAFTQRRYSFDRNFTFAGATLPLGSAQALGLGWTGFRVSNIEARQGNTASPDALFANNENALALMWGYRLNDWLALGAGGKFVQQNLFNESATGYSATLGLLARLSPMLAFGAQWQDFVSNYRWSGGREERFPHTLMLGMAMQITPRSLITLDYHRVTAQASAAQNQNLFRFGTEFRAFTAMPLRMGYTQNELAFGLGFEAPLAGTLMKLDYNFSAQDGLNQEGHALSLGFEFGRSKQVDRKDSDSDFARVNKESALFILTKADTVSAINAKAVNRPFENSDMVFITASISKSIVYAAPKISAKRIGLLRVDTRYEVARQKNGWYQIKLAGKKMGWVKKEHVAQIMASKKS